jgi:hypothetical protein
MRRLPSSYNNHNITDDEIDEVIGCVLELSVEISLMPRDHGERVLIVGFSSSEFVSWRLVSRSNTERL